MGWCDMEECCYPALHKEIPVDVLCLGLSLHNVLVCQKPQKCNFVFINTLVFLSKIAL